MNEQGFFVYHIVTRKKMKIGQSIQFNKNQTNTLFHFFFERKHLNSSGEDSIQILKEHYTNEELHIKNENATVVMNYMDQTIRAIRETIVEMVRDVLIGLIGSSNRTNIRRFSILLRNFTFRNKLRMLALQNV
ncbi:group-specific protein [Bacillus cereus]|nr:group-specific protein [Bacillus cereus]